MQALLFFLQLPSFWFWGGVCFFTKLYGETKLVITNKSYNIEKDNAYYRNQTPGSFEHWWQCILTSLVNVSKILIDGFPFQWWEQLVLRLFTQVNEINYWEKTSATINMARWNFYVFKIFVLTYYLILLKSCSSIMVPCTKHWWMCIASLNNFWFIWLISISVSAGILIKFDNDGYRNWWYRGR